MRKALQDLEWLSQRLSGLVELGTEVKELEKLLNGRAQVKEQIKGAEAEMSKLTSSLATLKKNHLSAKQEMDSLDTRVESLRTSAELAEGQYAKRCAQAQKEFEALVLTLEGRKKELDAEAQAEAKRRKQDIADQVKVYELKLAGAKSKLEQFKETL